MLSAFWRIHILFWIVLLFCFKSINVQSQQLSFTLEWEENGHSANKQLNGEGPVSEFLKFKGAFIEGEEHYPYFVKSISLNIKDNFIYSIGNCKYEDIPDSLLKNISYNYSAISGEQECNVFFAGKNSKILQLKVSALKYNSLISSLQRLKSFEIIKQSIEDTEPKIQLKSTMQNSVLASGTWYKVKVTKTGIYKFTYDEIAALGLNNPANIKIFGNGGTQLSFLNKDIRPNDLVECPIYMNKGADGQFNSGDYLLFYATGIVSWTYDSEADFFNHHLHDYADGAFYFLTTDLGPATEMAKTNNNTLTENKVSSSYNDFGYFKHNEKNLIKSGRTWYSQQIDAIPFDTTFNFDGIANFDSARIRSAVLGRSTSTRYTNLYLNDTKVQSKKIQSIDNTGKLSTFGYTSLIDYSFKPTSNSLSIKIDYSKYDQYDEAFLEYMTINVWRSLKYYNTPQFFRDANSIGTDNIVRYEIADIENDIQIWDVTNINTVTQIVGTQSGSSYKFKSDASTLHEFAIVDPTFNYSKPITSTNSKGVGVVKNQNLHGESVVNMIIVAPDFFRDQADSLAKLHRDWDNLSVLVVTPEEIYNEFSSGSPDVSAMRDFFRYQYKNSDTENKLKYVLLFGDGSYNNHMYKDQNTNVILTYQSVNSTTPLSSYVSDDFFGLLDDNEGEAKGLLDIGIGRFPAALKEGKDTDAATMVNKIKTYYTSDKTDWRRTLCFLGDDAADGDGVDQPEHTRQADGLTTKVKNNYKGFETKKIYLDAYKQIVSATGPSYPDVHEAIFKTLEKGVLLFNYTGHGGENGLTGEKVIQTQDIAAMTNIDHLPLFITATCEFSRYDDVEMEKEFNKITPKTTAGETAILNSDGGALALFTTTRSVISPSNADLNDKVFNYIFENDSNGNRYRLGDIFRLAKNDLPYDSNKLNFTLLGDPAIELAYPRFKVLTDSINSSPVSDSILPVKAFSKVTVSGHVVDDNGDLFSSFNGLVYPAFYDKETEITTNGNENTTPVTYMDQSNLLFKGKASVENGKFNFSFIVPKDISYNIGKGKLSYYAENGVSEAKGDFREIYIGGTEEISDIDNSGPVIGLFLNDEKFIDGGLTNDSPYLFAQLSDENGINMTGTGIGHDLVAYIDYDTDHQYLLNDYYQSEKDDYQKGTIRYPLKNIPEGEHSLSLKAWDVLNNSSDASIGFVVKLGDGLIIESLINYPNPAQDITYFKYAHNLPGELHTLTLDVFDLSGRRLVTITRNITEEGYYSTPLEWDLRTSGGQTLNPGIYPYRIKVSTSAGDSYLNQKLIILR